MALNFGSMFTGNLKEISTDEIKKDYGKFLMRGEKIEHAFRLARDLLVLTDRRIIDIDLQGMSGKKKQMESIFYSNIINVSAETAGKGFDDSEISIHHIDHDKSQSPHWKKLEFPKNFDFAPVYQFLIEIAYDNSLRKASSSKSIEIVGQNDSIEVAKN